MESALTVTTLIENDSSDSRQFVAEHGLSLHIAHDGQNILFDTGATGAFADNAAKLGIDLAKVDLVIISHSHYDHTGGLARFFALNSTAPVYIHRLALNGYFSRQENAVTSIGLEQAVYDANSHRFIFIDAPTRISDKLLLTSAFDHLYPVPQSPTLLKQENDQLVVDDFQHEMMLVLERDTEIVVFTGCSHNGILNMVATARRAFPGKNIQAVFGGFHLSSRHSELMTLPEADVIAMAKQLQQWRIPRIFTGHCTGHPAFSLLKTVLKEKLVAFPGGTIIQL